MHTNNLPKSLQEENLLVDQLRAHFNYVCQQMSQTENRMEQLDRESSDLYYRLQRIQDSVCALKHKRYVQELIIDDNESRPSRQPKPSFVNSDIELRDSIAHATEQGLQLISQMFKPIAIQIPNQILSEHLIPNDIYEPIDSNLIRDLPPIIGSSGFNSWNVSEIIDRPTETSEITIGRMEVPTRPKLHQPADQQQPKPTTTQPISVQEVKKPSPVVKEVVQEPGVLDVSSVEEVEPKPRDEFLTQLNERLATENPRKEPVVVPDPPTKNVIKQAPTTQQRKPKVEEPSKKAPKSLLNDDSSSDDSLFKSPPVPQKSPIKKTETKAIPVQKTVEKPAKKSLFDGSDDSFDEVFQPPKNLTSTKTPVESKVHAKNEMDKVSPKPVENSKVSPAKPVSKLVAAVKRPEPKKRSIFDSSSSDEESPSVEQSKPPIPVESVDDEMPKSVLNSVSNDFSSRLNQALLKRPSPSPSSSITKSDEKPTSTPSTTPAKKEPIEQRKQESVAMLRGKLGDSIVKAHRLSAGSGHKPLGRESSSSDEAEVRKEKVEDQSLIQTLKARPRPARAAPRTKPPIPQTDEKSKDIATKKTSIHEAPAKEDAKQSEPSQEIKQEVKPNSQKSPNESTKSSTTAAKKPEVTSQCANKIVKPRKGLFDSSDSDDPF